MQLSMRRSRRPWNSTPTTTTPTTDPGRSCRRWRASADRGADGGLPDLGGGPVAARVGAGLRPVAAPLHATPAATPGPIDEEPPAVAAVTRSHPRSRRPYRRTAGTARRGCRAGVAHLRRRPASPGAPTAGGHQRAPGWRGPEHLGEQAPSPRRRGARRRSCTALSELLGPVEYLVRRDGVVAAGAAQRVVRRRPSPRPRWPTRARDGRTTAGSRGSVSRWPVPAGERVDQVQGRAPADCARQRQAVALVSHAQGHVDRHSLRSHTNQTINYVRLAY